MDGLRIKSGLRTKIALQLVVYSTWQGINEIKEVDLGGGDVS